MEDAIRQPDLAQSVQRYQQVVDEAKVRLNLAVCPGAWVMPVRMVLNIERKVGYNSKLKQAVAGMKLGINNEVNPGTKKAGLKLTTGGPSKINPPSSHPSNPIHKAAMAVQTDKPLPDKTQPKQEKLMASQANGQTTEPTASTSQHEINKTAVIIGVVRIAALVFMAAR